MGKGCVRVLRCKTNGQCHEGKLELEAMRGHVAGNTQRISNGREQRWQLKMIRKGGEKEDDDTSHTLTAKCDTTSGGSIRCSFVRSLFNKKFGALDWRRRTCCERTGVSFSRFLIEKTCMRASRVVRANYTPVVSFLIVADIVGFRVRCTKS